MDLYTSPQQGIKELVNELEGELTALASRMRAEPERMRIDYCALIPYRNAAEVDSKEAVPVSELEEHEAVNQVIAGLTAIRIEAGKQNPRETLRVPAAVGLPEDWIRNFADLNLLRNDIERLISSIDEQYKRIQIWRSMPYLSSLQTMRRSWITDAPASIRFYWDSVPSVKPSTVDQEIKKCQDILTKIYGHVPTLDALASDDRNLKYVFGLNALMSLPGKERVAIYRAGKPSIRTRITYIDKTIKPVIRSTPAPIIYDIQAAAPVITPLPSWEPAEGDSTPRSSRAKIEEEPFVESLFIHRYLPAFRETCRA